MEVYMLMTLFEPAKIEDLFKQLKHINTLPEVIFWSIVAILALLPFFKKFLAAKTFNNLDHLFITKYESQINKLLVNIQDGFVFLFFYIVAGSIYTFLIGDKLFTANIFIQTALVICLYIFLLTFILILLKLFVEMFTNKKIYSKKITTWLLYINSITSLISYYVAISHYFYYEKWKFNENALFLIAFPIFLFWLYKFTTLLIRQQENFVYIMNLVTEEEIKAKTLVFRYSFDTDRIVFTEPDDENFEKPYVYDRSQNQYFQYIRAKKQINHEIENKKVKVSTDYFLNHTDHLNPPAANIQKELKDPSLGLFFKELAEAPEERREQLLKIWEILKNEGDRAS
jgi:hypothetical protein